ncbi:receptor-interacting serine/threonine-protein kinase 2-like [Salvelinus namaycush]|uniref:Receptor-interacting serine/threonine-protein kinase 2 n=1 Tax=Salvelinus namaycush TaxID=8040 RepID=A0A8U1EJ82_SALNM|nr:receptor-interacting serine/threonine-protein kinase 2-like [Salvelinus namaycush]
MEQHHMGCVNLCSLTSTLPVIHYQKLTDLHYLSKGGFGSVFKALHSDWRTTVSIKCLKLDSPVGERERNCLLKEAEVLHKARFNYIIQIFGVCNEPEFFCIVTEYMSNGSLDQLLHKNNLYPLLAWSLRLRVLYEIALGVNFLHNMTPPLLHHDLKTQNILLDGEFHIKIDMPKSAKWRQLSISKGSGSKPPEMGGTIIYMPPEEYEPSKSRSAVVKHDIYSYAIIMWEVLSRRIPFEEVTNPMQVMFSVLRGIRPDIGLDYLPGDIPSRETLINLMICGWTANPDERPCFLMCVIELEPMLRRFDEIDILEAVLEVKKSKLMRRAGCYSATPVAGEKGREEKSLNILKDNPSPWQGSSGSESCSSQDTDIFRPSSLTSTNAPPFKEVFPTSFMSHNLEPLRKQTLEDNNLNDYPQSARPLNNLNIPLKPGLPETECVTHLDNLTLKSQPYQPQLGFILPSNPLGPRLGPMACWITARREEIVSKMTEACLNQSLDALLACSLLMREDYELVVNRATHTAKVRQLLDTCHRHSEDFCCVVVRKLKDNKQLGLQPYAPELSSLVATPNTSAPPLSVSYNNPRNYQDRTSPEKTRDQEDYKL